LAIVLSFPVDHSIVFSVNRKRKYNGQQKKKIEWSTGKDNTIVNRRRQYNGQQKKTITW
jgi:hypothetical protein